MALKKTEWQYAHEKPIADDFVEPVEGVQWAIIRKASRDEEKDVYKLTLLSKTNGAFINLSYYLTNMDQNGNEEPNARNRRTLISLTKALYGPDEDGIPYPDDIIGCAVLVDVKKSVSKTKFREVTVTDENGVEVTTTVPYVFWNVYDFKPVYASVALQWGNTEQYMIPDPVTEAGEGAELEE